MRQTHPNATSRPHRGHGDAGEMLPTYVILTGLSVLLAIAIFAVVQAGLLSAVGTWIENIADSVAG